MESVESMEGVIKTTTNDWWGGDPTLEKNYPKNISHLPSILSNLSEPAQHHDSVGIPMILQEKTLHYSLPNTLQMPKLKDVGCVAM